MIRMSALVRWSVEIRCGRKPMTSAALVRPLGLGGGVPQDIGRHDAPPFRRRRRRSWSPDAGVRNTERLWASATEAMPWPAPCVR